MDDSNLIKLGVIAIFFYMAVVIGCLIYCCLLSWNDKTEPNTSSVPSRSPMERHARETI